MLTVFISAIKIIFLLGFLIFIHEGGHFIAAKISGVKVNEFSIGFGPKIFQSNKTITKYSLRLFPLGGYVSMEGEVEKSDAPGSFSNASILKRVFIISAGGLVNIIFALVVYFLFTSFNGNFVGTTVDYVAEDAYTAQMAGIVPNDEILKVNNETVRFKSDITKILNNTKAEEVKLLIKRNKEKFEIKMKPIEKMENYTGIYLSESTGSRVMAIDEDCPAKKYGIKENDIILEINGISTDNNAYKMLEIVSSIDTESADFLISRDNEESLVQVKFDKVPTYILGIVFKPVQNTFINNIKYGLYDTGDFVFAIGDSLKQLFTGKSSIKQLTGPVGISSMISKTKGLGQYIYYLALISLSLGITNLLPFPPLDGGKIVFLAVEGITKKPVKENIEIGVQLAGFTLLILLSLYVTYNDIIKIF